jgi:hypothetical protein
VGLEKTSLEPQKSLGEESLSREPNVPMPDRDREDEEEDEEEEETTDPKKPTTDEVRTTGGERGVCWVAAFVLLICSHRA